MNEAEILAIVLDAIRTTNQTRIASEQLEVSASAPLFGPPSRLDSLGLVALLIDMEEAFERAGHPIALSDDRAMSQTRSPFRTVPSLVSYIATLTAGH